MHYWQSAAVDLENIQMQIPGTAKQYRVFWEDVIYPYWDLAGAAYQLYGFAQLTVQQGSAGEAAHIQLHIIIFVDIQQQRSAIAVFIIAVIILDHAFLGHSQIRYVAHQNGGIISCLIGIDGQAGFSGIYIYKIKGVCCGIAPGIANIIW